MTRLTELEIALKTQAPRAAQDRTPELQAAILEARRLQNQTLAQMIHAAYRGIAAFAGTLNAIIVTPLRTESLRRRTIEELNRLDARLLRDIGLERIDIEAVAADLAEKSSPQPAWISVMRDKWAELAGWIETARMRRRTIRSLEAQSDKVLEDIGIPRGQIEAAVHRLIGVQAARDEGQTQAAKARDHGLRAQALADLGYVKGDIDWVPEVVAERKLPQPANCNPGQARVA
jgi:uncharacterized protein YjiS (DUF1127 family)